MGSPCRFITADISANAHNYVVWVGGAPYAVDGTSASTPVLPLVLLLLLLLLLAAVVFVSAFIPYFVAGRGGVDRTH